ncbi:PEGA domain-containing protein [Methanofollis fontis]|nr:PEGA domain-containing protein [Methanofollis fontis]
MRRSYGYIPLLLLLVAVSTVSAATIEAFIGEDVPLSGTATGGGDVYLFLTGPNLAQDGVNLDRLTPVSTGSTSSFTVVSTDSENRWHYTWHTAGLGLDPAVYTLYASDTPAARSDLGSSGAVYGTVGISLRSPGLTLDTGGKLVITASVEGATVTINGEEVGTTPLTLDGVRAGEYTVTVAAAGYAPWTGSVIVENGGTAQVSAVLAPLTTPETPTATTAVPTTPQQASPLLPAAVAAVAALGLLLPARKKQ